MVLTKGRVGDGHPEAAAGPKLTRQNVLIWCGQSQREQEIAWVWFVNIKCKGCPKFCQFSGVLLNTLFAA